MIERGGNFAPAQEQEVRRDVSAFPLVNKLPKSLRKPAQVGATLFGLLSVAGAPACGAVSRVWSGAQGQDSPRAHKAHNPNAFLDLPFSPEGEMAMQQGWCFISDEGDKGEEHAGIDYIKGKVSKSPWKTFPVRAAAAGEACVNPPHREGEAVFIKHLANGKTYHTYYGHLQRIEDKIPECSVGETVHVESGEKVGDAGATGLSNGKLTHLHFQVNGPDNKAVDSYDIYGTRERYPNTTFSDGKLCGEHTLWRNCPIGMVLAAQESATPVPQINVLSPYFRAAANWYVGMAGTDVLWPARSASECRVQISCIVEIGKDENHAQYSAGFVNDRRHFSILVERDKSGKWGVVKGNVVESSMK